jgi:hypothetical protein
MLKDYAGSLAIVSEIEPKDAITQLLMQETYSRYWIVYLIYFHSVLLESNFYLIFP